MARSHILGYPRIGAMRELKFALEKHWRGALGDSGLEAVAAGLKQAGWRAQREAELDWLTAGDFSFYDHVLDTALDLGVGPAGATSLEDYFGKARGTKTCHAMEMTKWFDTNYHYLVPELAPGQAFRANPARLISEAREAGVIFASVKPVLLGPLTFLRLSKCRGPAAVRIAMMPALIDAYAALLRALRREGIEWVQLDEPALVLELEPAWLDAYESALARIGSGLPKLLLTTYFDSIEESPNRVARWPFQGIHLDLVRAPSQLQGWIGALPDDWVLSAGIIDGRNVWRNDLSRSLDDLEPLHANLGNRLWVAPSCSLLHVPLSLADEHGTEPDLRSRLAFAAEKLLETKALSLALNEGRKAVSAEIELSDRVAAERAAMHARTNASCTAADSDPDERAAPFAKRREAQHTALRLPLLPTTTIGSFPQTSGIRQARAALRKGTIDRREYDAQMRREVRETIERQEVLGLDVLVHGEPERNDMVEYFGERLEGCAVTANGWVQSYGSRCVKPPIIHGDVTRPSPMTVELAAYAQSLTSRPVKGMLTGPVTLLKWSFPRDDLAMEAIARQLALCVRREVADLQRAGIRVIQIDEPALREAMPLKKRDAGAYLAWSVAVFRLAASAADSETQIHTHMCYAEFNDILPAVAAMDADVVTLETSRSKMEVLEAFRKFRYPNEVGPGVYDIHSPRIPTIAEIQALIRKASEVIPLSRLWVNPDCGLKTRAWSETEAALANMVEAARQLRETLPP